MNTTNAYSGPLLGLAICVLIVGCAAPPTASNEETKQRAAIAAANLEDALVVDCQLPGKLQKLGGIRTYLTPGELTRLSAVECRTRGGEYMVGDLSSGTLSLERWLPLAQNGRAEAQYYVARIYANGMSGVQPDYAEAAEWYKQAADQGFSSALQELGYLYEKGLGVPQDAKMALDLQRKASGLGEELDYAWKIAAAKDEAAKQIQALTAQLDTSNGEVESLRAQLQQTSRALSASRTDLRKAEDNVLNLKAQIESAQSTADPERVHELERLLALSQQEVKDANVRWETLLDESNRQRAELTSRMTQMQQSAAQLNDVVAADKERQQSAATLAAQTELRLNQARQELADLRAQYRKDLDQITAERDALRRAAAASDTEAKSLLVEKQREFERQRARIQSLEAELETAKRTREGTAKAASVEVSTRLSDLQARHEEQQRQLNSLRKELVALSAKSRQERVAAIQDLSAQLDARNAELEGKQTRLASLELEASKLRTEVRRLNEQRAGEMKAGSEAASRMQVALRDAQRKLAEQQDQLDRLQTERASELASLSNAREAMRRQFESAKQANASEVALLKAELRSREAALQAKQDQIAALERQVDAQAREMTAVYGRMDPLLASNDPGPRATQDAPKLRSPGSSRTAMTGGPGLQFTPSLQGLPELNYHALIIGNSNYRHIESLDTPRNDARDLAELLTSRYGYKVTLLIDATAEDIMKALHEKTLTLGEKDNLLIYYAGHGDLDTGPERAYWLGVDAREDTRVGWLSAENIRAKIKQMRANHVLLVADSCFSGAITHPTTTTIGRALTDTRLRVQWNRRARMVLTSGQVQPVADRAGDPNHSFFAKYFLQILRQNSIVLSGEMLSHEINARMQSEAAAAGPAAIKQSPTYSSLKDADHNFGDYFFVPDMTTARVAAL